MTTSECSPRSSRPVCGGSTSQPTVTQLIRLPQYRTANVTIDPDHGFGRPRFARGGASVEDMIGLFRSGEPVDAVAERSRHRRAEIEAVASHQARCFVITRGDLQSAEMVARIAANRAVILAAAADPGPYLHAIQVDRLSRLYPPP